MTAASASPATTALSTAASDGSARTTVPASVPRANDSAVVPARTATRACAAPSAATVAKRARRRRQHLQARREIGIGEADGACALERARQPTHDDVVLTGDEAGQELLEAIDEHDLELDAERSRRRRRQVDVEPGDGAPVDGVLRRRRLGVREPAELVGVAAGSDERREPGKHADAEDPAMRDDGERAAVGARRNRRRRGQPHDRRRTQAHQCRGRYDFDSSVASTFCARRRSCGVAPERAVRLSIGTAPRPT